MHSRHLPLVLSATALVVAVLGSTGLGEAALRAVPVAVFAKNAGKVNNIAASRTPKAGQLLALNAAKKFPASVGAIGPAGPAGPAGVAGAAGPAGATGAAGPFVDTLPANKTVRGAFNIGGTAAAAGDLANTSISFVFPTGSAPTVHIVLQGASAPAQCPGNATTPQAASGNLCIYEQQHVNDAGVVLNAVGTFGATIFTNSTAAGGFYSFGAWAVTG